MDLAGYLNSVMFRSDDHNDDSDSVHAVALGGIHNVNNHTKTLSPTIVPQNPFDDPRYLPTEEEETTKTPNLKIPTWAESTRSEQKILRKFPFGLDQNVLLSSLSFQRAQLSLRQATESFMDASFRSGSSSGGGSQVEESITTNINDINDINSNRSSNSNNNSNNSSNNNINYNNNNDISSNTIINTPWDEKLPSFDSFLSPTDLPEADCQSIFTSRPVPFTSVESDLILAQRSASMLTTLTTTTTTTTPQDDEASPPSLPSTTISTTASWDEDESVYRDRYAPKLICTIQIPRQNTSIYSKHTTVVTADRPAVLEDLQEQQQQQLTRHTRWFGHGKAWTCATIVMAWIATICAISSARSTSFVRLQEPMRVGAMYQPVRHMGLLRVNICLNETSNDTSISPLLTSSCQIFPVESRDIADATFEWSRLFLMLGVAFGTFCTAAVTTAVYWQSINLRPIGGGFFVAYFLQAFALLVFDTDLCSQHQCRVGPGGRRSIFATVGWIGACLLVAKMDHYKSAHDLERRRAVRHQYQTDCLDIDVGDGDEKDNGETASECGRTLSTSSVASDWRPRNEPGMGEMDEEGLYHA